MTDWDVYPGSDYSFEREDFPPTEFELRAASLVRPGFRVLDIGAGRGRFVALALEQGAGAVVAVEPRSAMESLCDHAAATAGATKNGRYSFVCATWPEVSNAFSLHAFDLVFSQSSLHYLEAAKRHHAFVAVRDVLREHGIFALSVKSIDNAWISVEEARLDVNVNRWVCKDGFKRTFFRAQDLMRELGDAGFIVRPRDVNSRLLEGYEWPGELTTWVDAVVSPSPSGGETRVFR